MIIGICGKSCSGKTTISKILVNRFNFKSFCLETDYFKVGSNWENPEAYDFSRLINDIRQYRKNLIVEGFLIFTNNKLVNLIDKKIYLNLSDEKLIKRRLDRAIKNRKDNDFKYLVNVVIPEYKKHETRQMSEASLILNANLPIKNNIKRIIDFCKLTRMKSQEIE